MAKAKKKLLPALAAEVRMTLKKARTEKAQLQKKAPKGQKVKISKATAKEVRDVLARARKARK